MVSGTFQSVGRDRLQARVIAWSLALLGLVLIGVLLAWVDSNLLQNVLPQPPVRPRLGPNVRPPEGLPGLRVGPKSVVQLGSRGLFGFGWFVATGLTLLLLTVATAAMFPRRLRCAVERLENPSGLATTLAAGIAAGLLAAAATVLLRESFILLVTVPLLWALGLLLFVFGLACFALAVGRLLRRLLGPVAPLLLVLGGGLVIVDAALVPYVGWALLGVLLVAGLGLAVVTRMGSPRGWSVEDLNW